MFILQLIIKHQLQRDPSSLKYMLTSLERDQNNGTQQSTYITYIFCIHVRYVYFLGRDYFAVVIKSVLPHYY